MHGISSFWKIKQMSIHIRIHGFKCKNPLHSPDAEPDATPRNILIDLYSMQILTFSSSNLNWEQGLF